MGKRKQSEQELIAATVHELKSPLTLIQGLTSMLKDGQFGELDASQADQLDQIQIASRRLSLLVESLLHLDRLPYLGQQEPVQLQAELERATDDIKQLIRARGLQFQISNRNVPPVLAERASIYQVVLHILDAAIKFAQPGSTLTVDFRRRGGFVIMKVYNPGIEISRSDIKNLFRRFGKDKQPIKNNAGSSGLSLYIVKSVVEFYGGSLSVGATREGNCLTVRLPVANQLSLFEVKK